MRFDYSPSFRKQYRTLPKKIREQFGRRAALLLDNQSDSQPLRLHKLAGVYAGLWSMNVTGDVRAIFDRSVDSVILFVAIGTHSQLY